MKSPVYSLTIILICFACLGLAQPLFVKSDLPGSAYHITPLENGESLVFGTGYGTFLFKLHSDGAYGWHQQYGPQGFSNGSNGLSDNLEQRADQQGFVLSTVTLPSDTLIGHQFAMLYETDLEGSTVDSFIVDIPELQLQSGLHVIDDGDYILGGTLSGENSFREKGFVWRYNMEEDSIMWSHTFQNTNIHFETMISFIEGQGDTIFVGGYGPSLSGAVRSFLKAMGVNGEEYWTREYQENDYFKDALLLPDGIVVVGGRGQFGIAEGQMVIKKISYAGENLWTRTYDFPGRAIANGITGTPDGEMILCGWATSAGPVLLKIDQNGDSVWSRIVESMEGLALNGAGQDLYASADHITCVGWFFEHNVGYKCLIIQTNADGLLVNSKTIDMWPNHPLTVFPNPATSDIFVDLPTSMTWEDAVAEVYTTDGRLLFRQSGEKIRNGIEIRSLTPGLYYLIIRLLESGQSLWTASFVKK